MRASGVSGRKISLGIGIGILVVFLLGVLPARANRINVLDTSGFGASIGSTTATVSSLPTSKYSLTVSSEVFEDAGGTYTYAYTVAAVSGTPGEQLSAISLGTGNFLSTDPFGVITSLTSGLTVSDVPDSAFNATSWVWGSLTNFDIGGGILDFLTVYGQSHYAPIAGTITLGTINSAEVTFTGVLGPSGTIAIAVPEPSSLALLGLGLGLLPLRQRLEKGRIRRG